MSLKEKVKTAVEVWQHHRLSVKFDNLNARELSGAIKKEREKKQWIRLDDAQQEIDKLKSMLRQVCAEGVKYEDSVAKKQEEVKRRLKQIAEILERMPWQAEKQSREIETLLIAP